MSINLMSLAWKTDLPSGRKMVLLALCDNANDQGECYPSVGAIAQKCSMGERTVQQHITDMEAAGIVRRGLRNGRSTVYKIDPRSFSTPAEFAPPQIRHPAVSAPTPAESASVPLQISHPTPADLAPRTIKEPSIEPSSKRQRARGSRLLEDWALTKSWGDWALEMHPTWTPEHVRLVADKFRDHWISQPGQRGCKTDWQATWRNWCRNEKPLVASKAGGQGAWWATDASTVAKGVELGLMPIAGESMPAFKGRVQAAIDNGGQAPPPPRSRITRSDRAEEVRGKKPEGLNLKALIKSKGMLDDLP
ncbi:helix-turn-helix domain-containing protein [Collimonas sp. OK412]|uniref:helix-turn-helix domain-containing protein n=1 Tax=Collimonas sp. (strain OK412) TaxID=1801619 RepID=UPI000B84C031|nr:helix-turn-helix domain-containing protein [Collimonas sp. OK412]